jgi:hypothetical protein
MTCSSVQSFSNGMATAVCLWIISADITHHIFTSPNYKTTTLHKHERNIEDMTCINVFSYDVIPLIWYTGLYCRSQCLALWGA